ncbi:hypothetical protein ACFYRW_22235 [Rhodococcus pyridinivorans]|uniref:hypothetical protein n=1 Tax=Rhodococcus pyridinivorans TaxID=103816 RepID=UPI001E59FE89|nr:hypothetical protein [Rhodococcus pyridinivorans]MCD5422749.1 hypothetical protein [Rhodococcus pyridinivorans]
MTPIEMLRERGVETPVLPSVEAAPLPVSLDGALFGALEVCEQQRAEYEARMGFDTILDAMARFVAPHRVTTSIDSYRTVIRKNKWLYPTVVGPIGEVPTFMNLWAAVHTDYHTLATQIFDRVINGDTLALTDPELYAEVIASETNRGWVGKRSPIGPDRQIEQREALVEAALIGHLEDDEVDALLTLGGLLPTSRVLRSAEQDMLAQLSTLVLGTAGSEETDQARRRMLRDYTKYSVLDLDEKLAAFVPPRGGGATSSSMLALDDLLDRLPHRTRATVTVLLSEIRALNFLNLNLEPRFSFKSWAGLMHGLVFAAVRDLPGMSDDIYGNLINLKETK